MFPTYTYRLDPQWQLVSLPLQTSGERKNLFFPTAASDAFTYMGRYSISDSLFGGKGYWLKFNTPLVKLFSGPILTSDTFDVHIRWNLIGSISVPVPTDAITSIPDEMISSTFLSYESGGYDIADSIYPGYGYWVRVSSDGQLVLKSGAPTGSNTASLGKGVMDGFNKLTIMDARGNKQVLYFGSRPEGNFRIGMYDLPPGPPVDDFNARFVSNRMLETHPTKFDASLDYPLLISSSALPMRVVWEVVYDPAVKYSLRWKDKNSSDGAEYVMEGDGSITLGNEALNGIFLRAEQTLVPVEYALRQNYPNPFNPTTRILYQLPEASKVTIKIYNTLGQMVALLVDKEESAGFKSAEWNANDVASGIYFYRMEAASTTNPGKNFRSVEKMLLLR